MLLELNQLRGHRDHFERRFEPAAFDPQDDEYRVSAPVELTMDIEKVGADTFRVKGQARTFVELECGRCLESFATPMTVTFELRYVPAIDAATEAEREIAEDDLATAFYREGSLDVIDMLREQFQLALPMKPLCTPACRGLCPLCGGNLNSTDCGCQPVWDDPRLTALKGLLTPDKEN
ncbi:MAG: DUF177 domain-containing protein [Vicinamibacterales bacterium]